MILIIDNHKKSERARLKKEYYPFLKKKGLSYKIKNLRSINLEDTKDFDAILLTSGSVGCSVDCDASSFDINHPIFSKEINIIKKSKKPIFGICLGFQVICNVFEGKIKELPQKKKGIEKIEIRKKDDIFMNCPKSINVSERNKWVVTEVGKNLKVLATSKDGIEAVKHKTKPIYGVQFHPFITKNNQGHKSFENFLKLF